MATSFKLSFLLEDVSNNDVDAESRKSNPGQPRLPNGPFLIRMLIRNLGNVGLAMRDFQFCFSYKDANGNSRKSRPGQPTLPDGPFVIKMLLGSQGNLGLASRGFQMVHL